MHAGTPSGVRASSLWSERPPFAPPGLPPVPDRPDMPTPIDDPHVPGEPAPVQEPVPPPAPVVVDGAEWAAAGRPRKHLEALLTPGLSLARVAPRALAAV